MFLQMKKDGKQEQYYSTVKLKMKVIQGQK